MLLQCLFLFPQSGLKQRLPCKYAFLYTVLYPAQTLKMNSVLLILRMRFQEVNLLHRLPMKKNDLQEKEQNTCIYIPIPMFIHLLIAIHLKDSILSKIAQLFILLLSY